MFRIFNLVVMTKKEKANEALKNMGKLIDRDGDILRLSIENELLRLRLEQTEKNDKTPEIKFGGF